MRAARLATLEGAALDREPLAAMVMGHQEAIQRFEAQASAATADATRGYAEKTLPGLRKHLEMAKRLRGESGDVPRPR